MREREREREKLPIMLLNRDRLIFHGMSVAVQMDNKIYIIVLNIAHDMNIFYNDTLVISAII